MKLDKWILRWESVHPFSRMECFISGHQKRLSLGSNYEGIFLFGKGNVVKAYYLDDDIRNKEKKSLKLFKNPLRINNFLKSAENNRISLIKSAEHVASNKNWSNKALFKKYQLVDAKLQKLFCDYDLSRPEYFEKIRSEINSYLRKKGLKIKEIDDIVHILSTNDKLSILDQEQIDWRKLVSHPTQKLISIHQKKYGWIGSSESQKSWSESYFRNLLKTGQSNLKSALGMKDVVQQRSKIIKKYKISKTIQNYFKLIREFSYLRLQLRLGWVKSGYDIKQSLPAGSELYTMHELSKLLKDNEKLSAKALKNRNTYAFILKSSKLQLYFGKDAVKFAKQLSLSDQSLGDAGTILKGLAANRGYAVGKVRVINAHSKNQEKEMAKMKEGEILVTGMTRPHLIHAIKKAGAIVTDEGGITSHAAIISREFNIPCIIGTKIATKIFKTGDKVEVDANKGIVNMIKSKGQDVS